MKKTNLFATREEFERRAKVLIERWQKLFAFQCYGCRSLFQKSEELSNHNSTWCQMQVDIWYIHFRITPPPSVIMNLANFQEILLKKNEFGRPSYQI